MTTVRALPLITRPAQGEALDSWLHAIAVRHNTSLKALYLHMGVDTVGDERTRVTAATEVAPGTIPAARAARTTASSLTASSSVAG